MTQPTRERAVLRPLPAGGMLGRLDALQRRRAVIGFPYAVLKRYAEDHGGWLGSLVAYYGFFSLYPLVVSFATVATWLFEDEPDRLQRVLEALWSKLPFVSDELFGATVQEQVRDLSGQKWVLILSLLVALWGGAGVVRVLQDTVNTIWGVPRYRRPGLVAKLGRGLAMLVLLGVGIVGTAVVAGVTVAVDLPILAAVGAAVANIALATVITLVFYHLVIGTSVRTATLIPGALITALGAYTITLVGGLYVQHVISRMTGLYGPFASTIGLFAYVSLVVQVFVIGTEVNVVRSRRLWPRAWTSELGPADLRAIELSMRREALSPSGATGSTGTPPQPPNEA